VWTETVTLLPQEALPGLNRRHTGHRAQPVLRDKLYYWHGC